MNQDQIKFSANKFESYIATRSFALGTTGQNIPDGSEILFDGTTVVFNEEKYMLPQLRGAIRLGWLVPSAKYVPGGPMAAPVSANIGLRPAVTNEQSLTTPPVRTAAVTVQSDERVVGSRETRVASANQQRAASARGHGYDIEPQDARPVARTFKTSAKTSTDMSRAGEAIHQANAVKIDPGEGLSESEYLARLSEEDQAKYLADKEARKSVYDAELLAKGILPTTTPTPAPMKKAAAVVVSEGITSTLTTRGAGVGEIYIPTTVEKPVLSTKTVEGISFSNTNGPGSVKPLQPAASTLPGGKDGTADARRSIAKALCPDFPDNYSFDDHWKRRLARIQLDYTDRPDVIRAIFAAETDEFKRALLEEFPEAFAG